MMHMKKLSASIAIALLVVFIGWNIISEFNADDTVLYFGNHLYRLLYVAIISAVGGLLVWRYHLLSPQSQRKARIYAWGAAAASLSLFSSYFIFSCVAISSIAIKSAGSVQTLPVFLKSTTGVWILGHLLVFFGIVAYLWFEFYRALKSRV